MITGEKECDEFIENLMEHWDDSEKPHMTVEEYIGLRTGSSQSDAG